MGGGVVGGGEVRWGGGRITNTLVMQLVKIVSIFHLPFFQHCWTYFEKPMNLILFLKLFFRLVKF